MISDALFIASDKTGGWFFTLPKTFIAKLPFLFRYFNCLVLDSITTGFKLVSIFTSWFISFGKLLSAGENKFVSLGLQSVFIVSDNTLDGISTLWLNDDILFIGLDTQRELDTGNKMLLEFDNDDVVVRLDTDDILDEHTITSMWLDTDDVEIKGFDIDCFSIIELGIDTSVFVFGVDTEFNFSLSSNELINVELVVDGST